MSRKAGGKKAAKKPEAQGRGQGGKYASKLHGQAGLVARRMWVEIGASESETCAMAGITSTTLFRWRKDNGWDELRQAAIFRWADALSMLQGEVGGITKRLTERKDFTGEMLVEQLKLLDHALSAVERIKKIDRDVDYKRLAVKFMRGLTQHLGDKDPAALELLLPHIRNFTAEIVRA